MAGNRIDTLVNGRQIIPAMLCGNRRGAQNHHFRDIHLLEKPTRWVKHSKRRCVRRRNAASRCMYSSTGLVGATSIGACIATLLDAGVEVQLYHPLNWYHLHRMEDNRTHRKRLVIDGRVGTTGGVGIARVWSGDAEDEEHWRDTHYRVEGPVVAQVQAAFLDNWMKSTGHVLHVEDDSSGAVATGQFARTDVHELRAARCRQHAVDGWQWRSALPHGRS